MTDEEMRVNLHEAITGETRTAKKCPLYECSLGAVMPLWDDFIAILRATGPLAEARLALVWEDETGCAEARLLAAEGCLALAVSYSTDGEPRECVGARAVCKMMLRALEDHRP